MTGYPPEVGLAWPDILLSWPGRLDVAQHIEPIPAATAAAKLRTQRARLESARRLDADKGRLGDPVTDAAADDAADLADRVARGAARLFRAGHYLCVHAPAEDELVEAVAEVRAAAASACCWTPNRPRGGTCRAGPPPCRSAWTAADAAGVRHRRPRRRVPPRLRRPARAAARRRRTRRRGAVRAEHRLQRGGVVEPVGPGQPQLGRPGPLRRRQVLPRQAARSCATCTTASRCRSSTRKTSTCAWPRPSAAPPSSSAPPASGSTRSTSRPATAARTR